MKKFVCCLSELSYIYKRFYYTRTSVLYKMYPVAFQSFLRLWFAQKKNTPVFS